MEWLLVRGWPASDRSIRPDAGHRRVAGMRWRWGAGATARRYA
jgi:hypothetical protein